MSNLSFVKAFVVNANKLNTTAASPTALGLNEVGVFAVDQFGVVTGNAGATPNPASIKRIKISQQLGDSKYGTVSSKIIDLDSVKNWYAKKAAAAANQISYIGYDEADDTKDISVNCGKQIIIPFHIYNKKMARWYAPQGFIKRLVIDTDKCPDCGSPCTASDKTAIATEIANQINNSVVRDIDYPGSNELANFLTATVVTNGLTGDDLRVGVKVVGKANDNDDQQSLSACDPVKYWEFQTTTFEIGEPLNINLDEVYRLYVSGGTLPITRTQQMSVGTGWAAALAALEAESQGFDRVRDPVTAYPYSKKNNYKILAAAGTKYDYFHLNFIHTHNVVGTSAHLDQQRFELVFATPTTTGDTLETLFNTWLAGKFTAVNLNP